MHILKRDGVEVTRGTWSELVEWIHRNHCYSFDHAIKHEGYSVEEVK